jgi:hypothetical protein
MTDSHSEADRGRRQLKAVSYVITLCAVVLGTFILTLGPSEAKPIVILIPIGALCIAFGLWSYAQWPSLFCDDGFGDPLRTHYRSPAEVAEYRALQAASADVPALASAARTAPIGKHVPVTEHIYAWQSVRRVPAGEKVWNRRYIGGVAAELILGLAFVLAFSLTALGVTLGLGRCDGPVFFVVGCLVLSIGFALSHRSGIVDTRDYPTVPMAPMPDLHWQPVLETAGQGGTVKVQGHAA